MNLRIDARLLEEALGRPISLSGESRALGYVDSLHEQTLTFLDDPRFVDSVNGNPRLSVVIATPDMASRIRAASVEVLVSEDPRHDFYALYNHVCRRNYRKVPSVIHPSAEIHPRAFVSDFNVRIGAGTVVHPMASVMPDVEIGARCVIYSGAVVGLEGYEKKRTRDGLLSVLHTGRAVLHDDVEVGGNACVAKGMYLFGDTTVGSGTRINGLAFVGHGVTIGRDCLLHLGASVSGASVVGDRVWIGPKATVSSGLKVADDVRISLGAVVTRDLPAGAHVTGNFAIDHELFLRNLKKVSA